jgi:acyl-phosphate glycerol 3-phosphate acyltransferase
MLASMAFSSSSRTLIGSISFAVVTSRALRSFPIPTITARATPGATNVLRTGNKLAAILTLVGDAAKGWLAVYLAQALGPNVWSRRLDGCRQSRSQCFLGHLFPVFHRFAGGKGVRRRAASCSLALAARPRARRALAGDGRSDSRSARSPRSTTAALLPPGRSTSSAIRRLHGRAS